LPKYLESAAKEKVGLAAGQKLRVHVKIVQDQAGAAAA
jgi:hypothetical protein